MKDWNTKRYTMDRIHTAENNLCDAINNNDADAQRAWEAQLNFWNKRLEEINKGRA